MIEFLDVTFEYPTDDGNNKCAVNGFSYSFEKGGFYAVIGPNGSGKSTVSKLCNGLYKPKKGIVKVDGYDTNNEQQNREIKRKVGLVFQNPDNQLVATVVEDDVAFGPENMGIDPRQIRTRVDDALSAVNMSEYAKSAPHHLSGGQKQRVAIAGILAMEPDYIVLDEPTAMLDPKGRSEVMATVSKLNKEKNITVILITHYMEEANFADRVLVINHGKLIKDGSPNEIFSDYELLQNNGLDVPDTSRLIMELSSRGVLEDKSCFSVQECADIIANAYKRRK